MSEEEQGEVIFELSLESIRDLFHRMKLWFGFRFLGWFKPMGYEWGYFVDKRTAVIKYRDKNRVIHTIMYDVGNEGFEIKDSSYAYLAGLKNQIAILERDLANKDSAIEYVLRMIKR